MISRPRRPPRATGQRLARQAGLAEVVGQPLWVAALVLGQQPEDLPELLPAPQPAAQDRFEELLRCRHEPLAWTARSGNAPMYGGGASPLAGGLGSYPTPISDCNRYGRACPAFAPPAGGSVRR
jgi:hypothetical protein